MKTASALEILRCAKADFAQRYGIERIGLFGSVARNEATHDSDVDIFVTLTSPDFFRLVELREELSERFGVDVDLVHDHAGIRPLMLSRIERDAKFV